MAASAPATPGPPTHRAVVVSLFTGQRVVQRLGPGDADPTTEALEAIAVAFTPSAGGVRPVVRVLAQMPVLRARGVGSSAPAGSLRR